MARPLLSILLAVGLATAMWACGGSSKEATTAPATPAQTKVLSKAEWIERADAICEASTDEAKTLKREFEASLQEPNTDAGRDDLATLLEEGAQQYKKSSAALRALTPPAGDADTIEEFLSQAELRIDTIEGLAEAIADNDTEKFEEVNLQGIKDAQLAAKLARSYGLKVCGGEE